MDLQPLFNIAVALVGALGGWVLNSLHRALERLDEDVRSLPANYVLKDDYREDIREIKKMLGGIYDRLNAKADK